MQAYTAKLQAGKVQFEAYETAVRGETAKAQILDVDARVFATQMQGKRLANPHSPYPGFSGKRSLCPPAMR